MTATVSRSKAESLPQSRFQGVSPAAAASAPGEPDRTAVRASQGLRTLFVCALLAALGLGAWHLGTGGYFEAGDDVGYTLGLVGGVMMLLLFSYPLRKHLPALRGWGRVKWWFVVHMVLGIGGPLLILVHTTFRVGSLNAAVALYSMLIVAGSGVVGRFLYVRVHRGLQGEKLALHELEQQAGLDERAVSSRLAFAPQVLARLQAFRQQALREDLRWRHQLALLFVLPLRRWWAYRQCCRLLQGAKPPRSPHQRREERALVQQQLLAVSRVAQFSVYARIFALWHVAHVPFVYLLVLSAVVHVVAVHAY
jgi:hypothetical protein